MVVSSLIIFNDVGEYWIVYDIIIIIVLCVFLVVFHTFETRVFRYQDLGMTKMQATVKFEHK